MKLNYWLIAILLITSVNSIFSQTSNSGELVREYNLTVDKQSINITGKPVKGMTINGSIPGPTLEFVEGEQAVINVTNNMDVETSIHWHGILLPNFQDGVPYLTTPPIKPGTKFTYTFPIKQAGTYWYHSHTMLQEQSGLYGSILIHPKEKTLKYDKDLVLLISDWTNEKPKDVLRNLKRGTEWYGIKKGTAIPLNKVIAKGGFAAQLDFWRQRMEGTDIADVYYPAFLINGKPSVDYPEFKPGEKIRLRIINGAASTSFWMTFGGEMPTLVSADGLDVVPVKRNKTFIAIAETYDFIVTIPENGKIEFKANSQDGSGSASAFLGTGNVLKAVDVVKPDKIAMMKKMANMKMKMGAHAIKFQPNKDERYKMKEEYGMKMDHMTADHSTMKQGNMNVNMKDMEMKEDSMTSNVVDHSKMDHSKMNHESMKIDSMKTDDVAMDGMKMNSEYNYDYLKSAEKTNYSKGIPVTEILLNLTGNMNRYIWSFNGVPLSETDNIPIKGNEVTRITFNNLTMMHHPLHLHGHFFRVLNKNGDYSPLKHTVNIPPMEELTIEVYGDAEDGDWLFHCHILYHMMSGMTRVFSYNTPRDERLDLYPVSKLINETDRFYSWGTVDVASHMTEMNLIASNMRNQFNLKAEYGWNKNIEAEFTYERYLHDYLRVFGGVNVENEYDKSLDEINTTAIVGVRYLTPYLFNLDVRVDNKLRPEIRLDREIMLFPRTFIFGNFEYQANFGWVDNLPNNDNYKAETTWSAGIEYLVSKNISLQASYDNRFKAGGGLSVRF